MAEKVIEHCKNTEKHWLLERVREQKREIGTRKVIRY